MPEECCPRFDPTPWDGKVTRWDHKMFIMEGVRTLMHVPLKFGGVMTRLQTKVKTAHATMPDYMYLSEHTSRWNMDVFVAVDRKVPGAENVSLSGTFVSKVYEGPYSDTNTWCDDLRAYAANRGYEIRKWYMWYTTCPKCAKEYEKNYVVIVGEVTQSTN